jgi:hypothetical protein
MPPSRKPVVLAIAGVLVLGAAVLGLTPTTAEAQCGSQASSCKNCHEVQAQDPVNAVGDWHISHAFGDFCEFCHAGNVQATDAETAHVGMVDPLSNPPASCSACHPSDAYELAVVYGTALGVEVGSGPSAPATTANAALPAAGPTAASASTIDCAEFPAAGLIDYNALYAESAEGGTPWNTGDVIIGLIIAAIVLGGGGSILRNERRRLRQRASAQDAPPQPEVGVSPAAAEPLLAGIAGLDPLGRRALERLLQDPQSASNLLHRLSRLDPDLIRTLRGLDRETRALLLALASEP